MPHSGEFLTDFNSIIGYLVVQKSVVDVPSSVADVFVPRGGRRTIRVPHPPYILKIAEAFSLVGSKPLAYLVDTTVNVRGIVSDVLVKCRRSADLLLVSIVEDCLKLVRPYQME